MYCLNLEMMCLKNFLTMLFKLLSTFHPNLRILITSTPVLRVCGQEINQSRSRHAHSRLYRVAVGVDLGGHLGGGDGAGVLGGGLVPLALALCELRAQIRQRPLLLRQHLGLRLSQQ